MAAVNTRPLQAILAKPEVQKVLTSRPELNEVKNILTDFANRPEPAAQGTTGGELGAGIKGLLKDLGTAIPKVIEQAVPQDVKAKIQQAVASVPADVRTQVDNVIAALPTGLQTFVNSIKNALGVA